MTVGTMNQLDIPTLAFAIALSAVVSALVLLVIWRINRGLDGVLHWLIGAVLTALAFTIMLYGVYSGNPQQYFSFANNALTLPAMYFTLEGSLRFRGFLRLPHTLTMALSTSLFILIAWVLRNNPVPLYYFLDMTAALILFANAMTMLWKPSDRHELKVHGLAALFSLLLAIGFIFRWTVAWNNDAASTQMLLPVSNMVFAAMMLYVMGWTFSVIVACYFREHREALQLARHDPLTRLPNRRSVDYHLDRALVQARRYGQGFGVIIMDLNRFKLVNDQFGHNAGDKLLVEVARRLQEFVREADFVARLGGDEFFLLVHDIRDANTGEKTLKRLHECISGPAVTQEVPVTIDISAGIALWPDDGDTADILLSTADRRMYRQKSQTLESHSLPDHAILQIQ
jgi:diguanylate cyclase (GGDEF)-like protein